MSGILGFYSDVQTHRHQAVLDSMQAAIAHRGPDGVGIWTDGPVALGHQRFVTTPEAKFERSPLITPEGYGITADVRLDNRDELITDLNLNPPQEIPITDPELILQAYQRWGKDCPNHLLGAFAFVIWDPQQQHLFGARDHMGVKPFYYSRQDSFLAFASEIKALLRSPQISPEINARRIANLLTSNLNDATQTCYQQIHRLPAAHCFHFTCQGELNIQPYWTLDPHHEIQLANDEAYIKAFLELFDQAIQCRLRRSVPIGSHLSGGMDSSSIAVTAAQMITAETPEQPLKTFSATFKSVPQCDESGYIHDIVEANPMQPYFVAADQIGPLDYWEEMLRNIDEPTLGNGYLNWCMNLKAHAEGVQILLNGYDGDTTIGHGTQYPHELAKAGQWKKALTETRLLAERFAIEGLTPLDLMRRYSYEVLFTLREERQWGKICRSIPQIFAPLKLSPLKITYSFLIRPLLRNLLGRDNSTMPSAPVSSPDTLLDAQLQSLLNQDQENRSPSYNVRQEQWKILTSGMMTLPMELIDHTSAPFQIEPRFPLMDKRLVEFCLSLPPHQKLRQGWTRFILRNSMTNRLPPQIQWRGTKTDLSQAFEQALLKYNRPILNEVFQTHPERIQTWVNLNKINDWVAQGFSSQNITKLWPTITFSLWRKQHNR